MLLHERKVYLKIGKISRNLNHPGDGRPPAHHYWTDEQIMEPSDSMLSEKKAEMIRKEAKSKRDGLRVFQRPRDSEREKERLKYPGNKRHNRR